MQQQQAPPAQPGMADAVQSANPMSIAAQPVGVSGPTPEDVAAGIMDQLKTMVQIAQTVAGANSQIGAEMEAITKLCIQSAAKTQQQTGSQQPAAPGGY